MTRQVTDQLYIDLEYFTPEEYYVYIAEASASLSAEFTQSVQGYKTVEIVLAAFSDAALTADVEVTKSTTVSVSSAFSLEASASGFENAEAALTSTATIDCVVTKIVSGLADISAAFTQITVADRVVNATVALESSVSMATVATRSVTFGSGLSSNADCACVNYRVREFDSAVGALFNTAVQAVATVNSFAVLDSVSTLTADVTRQVGASSAALSSAFTQTIQGQRVRFADSQLSSAFTQTVTGTAFEGVTAALSSSASLTAELTAKLRPAGYIVWPDDYGTVLDDGRLSFTQRNTSNFAQVVSDDTAEYANQLFASSNFTVEFLLTAVTAQFQGLSATTTNSDYYRSILNFESGKLWIALRYATSTTAILQFGVTNDAGTTFILSTTGLSSLAGDSHIALVKSGTSLYAFVNGTRVNTTTVSGVFTLSSSTAATLGRSTIISVSRNNLICKIDELRFSIVARYANNSTITVPTTPFANDKTGIALFHMDNDLSPAPAFDLATAGDNGLTLASAALAAAFTQSANVERLRTVSGSADLSSSFALSAIIGSIEEISSSMFDDVELSATASVTRTSAVSVSSQFTQTATSTRIQSAASALSTEFTQVADVQRTRTAESALASAFTVTADVDLVADINSSLSAVFTQSATADRTRSTAVSLTTAFTQTANNVRVRYAESAQSSAFTQTADVQRVQQVSSDLSAAFTQTTSIDRFRTASLNAASEFAQSTAVDRIRYGLADVSTAFTQVADVIRIQQGSADISAAFEQTSTANVTRNLVSAQSAIASTTTNAVKTVDAVIATEAIATQLTAIAKNATGTIIMESQASMSVTPNRVIEYVSNSLTGVRSLDSGDRYSYINGTTFLFVEDSTVSIWFKKDSTDRTRAPIWATFYSLAQTSVTLRLEYFNNTSIRMVSSGNSGEPLYSTAITNAVPTDGEPHHYVFRRISNQSTLARFELWRDGVSLGQMTIARDSFEAGGPNLHDRVDIGHTLGLAQESDSTGKGAGDSSFYQIWTGIVPNFNINVFYNGGAVDLDDGTAYGQLPTPKHYNKLTNPYTGVTFVNTPDNLKSATELLELPDLVSRASLTAGITVAALFAANLQSTSTLSATVVRIQANSAALSSAFAVTANITVNIGTITTISSQAALSVNAGYLLQAASTQSSEFTVQAVVGAIGDNSIDMFSAFAVTADANVIPPIRTEAALSSAFTVAVNAGFREQSSAELSSAFAVSADVAVIPPIRIEANLSSQFAVTASIAGTFDNEVNLSSEFTQTTSGVRIRRPSAGLQAQATLSITAGRLVAFQANLPAVATQLTVGSMISIDQFYQYKVESETRRGTVLPENRVFQVESETRVNMIL